MIKNYLYSLIAVAALLFATACSESEQASEAIREVEATFCLTLNEGVDTRAIGDGTTAKALLYEIRRGNQVVKKETIADAFADGLTYRLKVEVYLGVGYEYIFWAQKLDAPYGTEDLSAISMNYENAPANDEGRDAFYAVGRFTGGELMGNVVLKRPFAQLNVGAQECVYEAAVLGNMHMDYSRVELKKIPTVFHPLTGGATDLKDIEFQVALTPEQQTGDTLVVTMDSVAYEYRYLSMNYLLAYPEKMLFDSWVGLYGTPTIQIMGTSIPNVPLQRNYRTNILFSCGGGNPEPDKPDGPGGGGSTVVFGDVTFTIIIDPNFNELAPGNPDYVGPPFE